MRANFKKLTYYRQVNETDRGLLNPHSLGNSSSPVSKQHYEIRRLLGLGHLDIRQERCLKDQLRSPENMPQRQNKSTINLKNKSNLKLVHETAVIEYPRLLNGGVLCLFHHGQLISVLLALVLQQLGLAGVLFVTPFAALRPGGDTAHCLRESRIG